MSNPLFPHDLDRKLSFPTPLNARNGSKKKFPRFIPLNPLISLDFGREN